MFRFLSLQSLFGSVILAIVLLSASAPTGAQEAGDRNISRRVALVIGNSAYKTLPSLPNPTNDVGQVAATLKESGFAVTVGINVDRLALEGTVREFLRAVQQADVALVYYSGHGIQVAGQNFLVPVDATLESAYDVETQTMSLDLILDHLKQDSRVQLIFLDACRNNPFNAQKFWMAQTLQPVGTTRGLARIDGAVGSLIAFSTEPGQVALDGSGALSPYSESFVKHASEPAKEIRQILTDVRRDVIAATDGKQVPWENSSLTDNFYFRPAPAPPSVDPMQQITVQAGSTTSDLPIIPPHNETGTTLTVTINQLPQAGKLLLNDGQLQPGEKLAASDLPRLSYDATEVAAGTVGLLGYSVADPYGQATQGVVALTVSENVNAKLAERKRRQEQLFQEMSAYVDGLNRSMPATIGVGPIPTRLPEAPATMTDLTLRVTSLPDKGIVRAADRAVEAGYVIEASELAKLTYEPQIGTEGQSFKLTLQASDPGIAPATLSLKPVLDPCDSAAAAPLDLQGVTTGKLPNEIDPKLALPACTEATKIYPQVPRFLYQLGRAQLANRQSKVAFETIKKAMDAGHTRAIENLASLYALGVIGPSDVRKSSEIVQAAAEKGDPYALYAFGKDLYYGRGVTTDTERGMKLMLQSSELGHTFAMNELGNIFLNGINIAADPQRAIRFYEVGVRHNDIYSMNNLALIYRFGNGAPIDLDKALDLFTRAAEGGQPYAPTNLGRMYRDGVGVKKDRVAAARWLEMGAERGDYWGALDRAHLAQEADQGKPNTTDAAHYLALASALNMPGTGDPKNQAATELANLPEAAKKKAEAAFLTEFTAQERTSLPKAKSLDERLAQLAHAAWVKRNPRYDLF
ncbi:caspase family protein [Rhizobium lusitanum]|uniref:TPR repeat protein n=1 Tax=Rhizobium lusitanum TaxID=293958 RepID=A0A7X0ITT5_9HYPH|nr:caspase family protein [Rhizobium lusitanum]MBB6487068.1 TPR repeat protein [Rhizobium lusitanum]